MDRFYQTNPFYPNCAQHKLIAKFPSLHHLLLQRSLLFPRISFRILDLLKKLENITAKSYDILKHKYLSIPYISGRIRLDEGAPTISANVDSALPK